MAALSQSFHGVAEFCGSYLLHASWQAALVGGILLALVFAGRRWPAPLRYGLLLVALLKFILPPFLTAPSGVLSYWSISANAGNVAAPRVNEEYLSGRPSVATKSPNPWNSAEQAE